MDGQGRKTTDGSNVAGGGGREATSRGTHSRSRINLREVNFMKQIEMTGGGEQRNEDLLILSGGRDTFPVPHCVLPTPNQQSGNAAVSLVPHLPLLPLY